LQGGPAGSSEAAKQRSSEELSMAWTVEQSLPTASMGLAAAVCAAESSLSNAQGNLGDIPPQDRAGTEKQIIALGLELKGLEAQLKTCRGG
jgi:hypothetical protein